MQGCHIQQGRQVIRLAGAAAFVAALLAGSTGAFAQSRAPGAVGLSTPGALQQVGRSGSAGTFNSYSYGLGAVGQSSSPTENVLQTSISRTANYSISRKPGSSSHLANTAVVMSKATRSTIYQPLNTKVQTATGLSFAALSSAMSDTGTLGTESYLHAIGAASTDALSAQDQPITSLVPNRPGKYRNLIARGEKLFRAGKYAEAFDTFKRASYMNRRDPAILLGMSHAEFGMGNFPMATYYLQRALRFLPELPSVPLRPRGFFADQRRFSYNTRRLKDRIRERPTEAGSYLLLAYLQWFKDNPDTNTVKQTLSLGLSAATEPELVDAFEIFRDAVDAISAAEAPGGLAKAITQPTAQMPPEGNSPGQADQATSPGGTKASGQ